MTNSPFHPDDPRLTAYVLGEIDDADRREIERLLETSPEAQAAVQELEETIGALREGLAGEPAPALTSDQREAVEQQARASETAATLPPSDVQTPGRRSRTGIVLGAATGVLSLGLVAALVLPSVMSAKHSAGEPAAVRTTGETSDELVASAPQEQAEDLFGQTSHSRAGEPLSFESQALAEKDRGSGEAQETTAQKRQRQLMKKEAPGSDGVRGARPNARPSSGNGNPAAELFSPPSTAAPKSVDVPVDGDADGDGDADQGRDRVVRNGLLRPEADMEESSGTVSKSSVGTGAGAADSSSAAGRQPAGRGNEPRVEGPRVGAPRVARPDPETNWGSPGRPAEPSSASARRASKAPALRQAGNDSVRLNSDLQRYLESDPKYAESARKPDDQSQVRLQAAGSKHSKQTDSEQKRRVASLDRQAAAEVRLRESRRLAPEVLHERLRRHDHDPEFQPKTRIRPQAAGNEAYEPLIENDFVVPVFGDEEKCLSTLSVDVDTASYSNVRRFLQRDQLPPPNAVRIEELINYFDYDYPEPEGAEPFSVTTELAECPWQPGHRLAMVGLKAKTIEKTRRPPTNLVFLLDVSGSMRSSNKLPLVQQAMRLLVSEMTEDDRVAIVTYASNAGLRLDSTLGSKKEEILNVIDGLRAGGSTNGSGGIEMAYDVANRHYLQGGSNRVILCTDGDFNVGISSDSALVELIQEKAASGVFLSVFGFGMGNLKDSKLEKLADKGNGHYGYIDDLNEAGRVFRDELVGTLYTVAKDVKLQVEFNPATVGAYRLIGYGNRKLAARDFTDDTKDAGEIGSGHTVTALYEVIPKQLLLAESRGGDSADRLKYQPDARQPEPEPQSELTPEPQPTPQPEEPETAQQGSDELLTVRLRYKLPDEETSQPVANDFPVQDLSGDPSRAAASDDLLFAASVASFGMNLRGSKYRGEWGLAEVLEAAQGSLGDGNVQRRKDFLDLIQRTIRISGGRVGPKPSVDRDHGPGPRRSELAPKEARLKASVDGKYRRLVKKIEVRDDFRKFGSFEDYGYREGTEYAGHKDLLPGYWVYVYPHWYIWAEKTDKADAR